MRPSGAAPLAGPQGAPKKEKKSNPRKQPGFAKWKIVHAEYTGKKGADDDDKDFLLAHMRSGKNSKFVMRCHVDSDDYGSLDKALGIDGEPEILIGEMIMMSTNRGGPKVFRRAAPLPWREVTVLSGDTLPDGGATLSIKFEDHGDEANLTLSAEDAAGLVEECGGEEAAIGVRVRYRIMPDDSIEARQIAAAHDHDDDLEDAA